MFLIQEKVLKHMFWFAKSVEFIGLFLSYPHYTFSKSVKNFHEHMFLWIKIILLHNFSTEFSTYPQFEGGKLGKIQAILIVLKV